MNTFRIVLRKYQWRIAECIKLKTRLHLVFHHYELYGTIHGLAWAGFRAEYEIPVIRQNTMAGIKAMKDPNHYKTGDFQYCDKVKFYVYALYNGKPEGTYYRHYIGTRTINAKKT